jgi:hypothetical protein
MGPYFVGWFLSEMRTSTANIGGFDGAHVEQEHDFLAGCRLQTPEILSTFSPANSEEKILESKRVAPTLHA